MEQENQSNLPERFTSLPPTQVTEAKIRALFNTMLIRMGYTNLLQGLESLTFDKNFLQPSYAELKASDKFLKEMEIIRTELSKPYSEIPKMIKRICDEITAPISKVSASKKAELKAANELAQSELRKIQAENARVESIKIQMGNFINQATKDISLANNDTDIVAIQKRIGAEKSRSTFYAEFLDEFKELCDGLTPLINQRKEHIRKAQELAKAQEQAKESNDPIKAAQLKGEMEYLEMQMTENTIRLQEKAFEQATSIEIATAEPMIELAKAKTTRWLWKVDDISLLYKKMPHLVELIPNKEAIDTILKTKRLDGSLKGKTEEHMNGITFYQEKYY